MARRLEKRDNVSHPEGSPVLTKVRENEFANYISAKYYSLCVRHHSTIEWREVALSLCVISYDLHPTDVARWRYVKMFSTTC